MAGRTNYPPSIPFPLLFLMLLKPVNLWIFDQIFTVYNENPKHNMQ